MNSDVRSGTGHNGTEIEILRLLSILVDLHGTLIIRPEVIDGPGPNLDFE